MTPDVGQCWLIAAGASGLWLGKDGSLAAWTSGGWRYVAPQPGLTVWDKNGQISRRWSGSNWTGGEMDASAVRIGGVQVVGPRQPDIQGPTGGLSIDQEARTAIDAVIVALKSHGLIE